MSFRPIALNKFSTNFQFHSFFTDVRIVIFATRMFWTWLGRILSTIEARVKSKVFQAQLNF